MYSKDPEVFEFKLELFSDTAFHRTVPHLSTGHKRVSPVELSEPEMKKSRKHDDCT